MAARLRTKPKSSPSRRDRVDSFLGALLQVLAWGRGLCQSRAREANRDRCRQHRHDDVSHRSLAPVPVRASPSCSLLTWAVAEVASTALPISARIEVVSLLVFIIRLSSLNQFDLSRPPGLVDAGLERAIHAQTNEEALARDGLEPVALHGLGCLGSTLVMTIAS